MQIPRSSACRNISRAFKPKTTRAAFFSVCLFKPAFTKTTRNWKHFGGGSFQVPRSGSHDECGAGGVTGPAGARSLNRDPVTHRPGGAAAQPGLRRREPRPGGHTHRDSGTAWLRSLSNRAWDTLAQHQGLGFYLFAYFAFNLPRQSFLLKTSAFRLLLQNIKAQLVPR